MKTWELASEMIGPEQVSPHYENFMMSRKYALSSSHIIQLSGLAPSSWYSARTWVIFTGWLNPCCSLGSYHSVISISSSRPGNHSSSISQKYIRPLLSRFYKRIMMNEVCNLETYYHENVENRVRSLMALAKSQLDYKTVHNDYKFIRNESIMNVQLLWV